jgi:hypothetical protein
MGKLSGKAVMIAAGASDIGFAIVTANLNGGFCTRQETPPIINNPVVIILTTVITNQIGQPSFSIYVVCKVHQWSSVQSFGI